MPTFLIVIAVSLVDPIRALLTFAFVFLSRKLWVIPLAALLSSVLSGLLLYMIRGVPQVPVFAIGGFIASLMHAALFFWIVKKVRERRAQRQVPSP